MAHNTHSPIKQDRPNWRWHGYGKYTYTTSPEAARYVALCRQREIDKLHSKATRVRDELQWKLERLNDDRKRLAA